MIVKPSKITLARISIMKLLAASVLVLCMPVDANSPPPDVAAWNTAVAAIHGLGDAERTFGDAAKAWVGLRQVEMNSPGTVDVKTLQAYNTMMLQWQVVVAQQRAAVKAMHDFDMLERNR